jgi:hypothetical protein
MRKKKETEQRSILSDIRTSPLLLTLLAVIPMIWHDIFISIYGVEYGYMNTEGMTSKGRQATLIVFSLIALYILVINVYDRVDINHETDYSSIAKFVLSKTILLYESKLEDQKRNFTKFPDAKYDIAKRINFILSQLISCVDYASGIDEYNISATLFYSFDKTKDNWKMIERNYHDAFDGQIESVIKNEESFAHFLWNNKPEFYFINDKHKDGVLHKEAGKQKAIYTLNGLDIETHETTKKYGSIVGWKFIIKGDNNTYINAMLFISTYIYKLDKSILGGYKNTIRRTLRELIMPYFQMNLQAELIRLYHLNDND